MRRFQFSIRMLLAAVAIVAVAIASGIWFHATLAAKQKYDMARDALLHDLPPFAIVKMDRDSTFFLDEVRAHWAEKYSEVRGPITEALETAGLEATVANLAAVYTYQMPAYSFVSTSQNKKAREMGAIQAVIVPITIDNLIHASDDGHVAFVRTTNTSVMVFSDEPNGLREAMYYVKQDKVAPRTEGDGHTNTVDKH